MADATAMSRVLDIVDGALAGGRVVLVSSAISGCTDGLLACADGDREREAGLMDRHLAIVRRLFTGIDQAEASAEVMRLFAAMERPKPPRRLCVCSPRWRPPRRRRKSPSANSCPPGSSPGNSTASASTPIGSIPATSS